MVICRNKSPKTVTFQCSYNGVKFNGKPNPVERHTVGGSADWSLFMSKLVMNITNAQNLKAMVAWCKQYHIEYQVLEDVHAPALVDEHTPAQKPTASKTTKSRLDAKDVEIKISTVKTLATLGSSVSRDTFAVLKADADALGGEWDKTLKGFKFSTCKNAKAFSKRSVVTANERNAVRKDWGWA